MASYNGLAENINKTRLDNQKILKDLKKLETTIKYLKSFPPSELSEEIKTKIHLLVTSSQVLQARLFRSAVESKTLDELWEGNGMLKYLFESNIKHYSVNDQLKCLICDEWLPASRVQLKNHLEGSSHIQRYLDNIHGETMSYWKDTISLSSSTSGEMGEELSLDNDRCLMLKYGKFIDFNGPNDMLFCKLCCTSIPKNNNCLQAHFKESLHQELFKDVVNVIVGRTKNNLDKTKNKNIFTDSEPDSLTLMSFKNVQNNNGELATGTPIQPINQNRGDMESWFKDTIDKFIVEFLEDDSPNDKLYICSICQVRTTSYKRWQEHCFSVSHETRMILSSNVSYYPCQCSTEMICPNYIREYHMNKNHDRLLKLFNSLKLKQVRFDVSDDDDATSDEDNNNRSSILQSKFNNSVKNLGAKPKILNVHNGGDKRNNPFVRKQVKKIDENDMTVADDGNATPIGLSDIPDNASDYDLIREIQHFGSIMKIERVTPSFANVYIELREEFQSIVYLGLTITVKGAVVSVTDPILQSNTDSGANDARNKHVVDAQIPISISTKFQEESTFKSMVLELMARSEINDALSPIIKHHLKESLSLTGHVIIVGSQALKLTFDKSSTLDFFVEIDDNYFGKKTELSAVELSARTIRLFDLLKQSKHFKNVEIVGDNVQVLTLVYSETDRKCKIFFRDGLVVEKTNLSLIYLNCDGKIGEMVVAILEWFKEVGLRNVLPTYSILWLALFPLMTNHYLCPVVILRNHNDAGRKMISGWDCRYSASFSPITAALPSAYVLVRKFFEFYSDARNFDKKVLAPLTGEIFDQQRVRQKKLPPPYSRYSHLIGTKSVRFFKLSSGICLQDPLQLNYNMTLPLQGKNLNKFVASCKSTLQCFNQ